MHVLVVEDEPFIAQDIAAIVARAGWEVAGPAGSINKALKLLEEGGCDAAILDANLGGDSAALLADRLEAKGIPFMVLSGYTSEQLSASLSRAPFLAKPYREAELIALLRRLRP